MSRDSGLEKMTFVGYKDAEFKTEIGEISVQINPHTFTRSIGALIPEESKASSRKTTGTDISLDHEVYSFELVFDTTGVIGEGTDEIAVNDQTSGVNTLLDKFMDIVYTIETDKVYPIPSYLKMYYCGSEYRCQFKSIQVKYSLFNRDGDPLRATLTCSLKSLVAPTTARQYKDGKGDVGKIIEKAQSELKDTLF